MLRQQNPVIERTRAANARGAIPAWAVRPAARRGFGLNRRGLRHGRAPRDTSPPAASALGRTARRSCRAGSPRPRRARYSAARRAALFFKDGRFAPQFSAPPLQVAFHTLCEFDTRRSKRKRRKLVIEALNADPATTQIIYYGPHRGRVLVIIPVLHQCVHEENLFAQPFLAGKQLFAVGRDDPAVDHEVVSKFISKAIASGNLLRLLRSRQPCPPVCCTSVAHSPTPRFQLAGTQLAIIPFAKPLCGPQGHAIPF